MKQLVECIGIKPGITTFVGGGGKTTAIFQVARELKAQNKRVIVSTTTKMYYPTKAQMEVVLINPSEKEMMVRIQEAGAITVAGAHEGDKITGVCMDKIEVMAKHAEYVLIEGDGSKRLPLKVPATHEPVIPQKTQQIVVVVGMKSFGKPLEDVCFRWEKAKDLLGVSGQQRVGEKELAQIIISPHGLQKEIGERSQVLLINQVDALDCLETLSSIIKTIKREYRYPVISAALEQGYWEEV